MSTGDLFNDPHINQRVKDAARFINEFPGSKGEVIAHAIHVSFDHFRKAIVPILKRFGYRNYHNGNGYCPPLSSDSSQADSDVVHGKLRLPADRGRGTERPPNR
jgi:hypothetical protein